MRLEDFIKENNEAFNDKEPAKGHFEQFEARLKSNNASKRTVFKPYYSWIAASLTGLIIATVFFTYYRTNEPKACLLSAEVQNVRNYYSSQMNLEIKNLQTILSDVDPAVRNKIMADVDAMKNDSENLPKDFCDRSANKKAIAVIVTHYEAKIKAVQSIASFMEENKKSNS